MIGLEKTTTMRRERDRKKDMMWEAKAPDIQSLKIRSETRSLSEGKKEKEKKNKGRRKETKRNTRPLFQRE